MIGPAGVPSAEAGNSAGTANTLTAGAWDDNENFDLFSSYVEDHAALAGVPMLTAEERQSAHQDFSSRGSKRLLDIALVIDTTGSMRDEIEYLRAEFRALSDALKNAHPRAEQRWALVAYGDEGDMYVVDATDFTGDTTEFQYTLDHQQLTGGGDYPEAADRGLAALNELSWRAGSTARLAFWVADAPHHAHDAQVITTAMRDARDLDIHIYPVASSGVDALTELTMRSAAQITGGRYLFLTDDSGVGGAHKEPTIPCYFVTLLSDALVRMVGIEMGGSYREPTADELIRTGGDPEDGRCTLDGGAEARAF